MRKVAPGGTITTVASGLNGALTLATSGDGVDVAELAAGRVQHVAADGTATIVAGGGDLQGRAGEGQPATSLRFAPRSIARTPAGDLLVLSDEWLYTIAGGVAQTVVGVGASRVLIDGTGRVLLQAGNVISLLAPDGAQDDVLLDAGLETPVSSAVLADGRIAFTYDANERDSRVRVTTPTWATPPAQVTGVWVDDIANPPIVHWTPPAGWGDAIAVPVLRKGTVTPRTPTDGFDARYYTPVANEAILSFDEDGGIQYGTEYTVAVFSYSPSARVYSVPVATTFVPRIPPPQVTGLVTTPGIGKATFRWTNPAGIDGVVVRMAGGTTPPATPTSGTAIYSGTGTTVTKTGLGAGATYSFSFFTRNAEGVHSKPVTKTLLGTSTTIKTSATTITYGTTITISGALNTAGSTANPGGAVQLLARRLGTSTWRSIAYDSLASTRAYSFTYKPSYSMEYQVQYPGSGIRLGSYVRKTVAVRTRVTAAPSRTSLTLGGTVTIRGTVAPSHAGKQVTLQRYSGGVWRTVSYATLSSTSAYAITLRPGARGTYYYRVVKRADADHAEGVSATVRFAVG